MQRHLYTFIEIAIMKKGIFETVTDLYITLKNAQT